MQVAYFPLPLNCRGCWNLVHSRWKKLKGFTRRLSCPLKLAVQSFPHGCRIAGLTFFPLKLCLICNVSKLRIWLCVCIHVHINGCSNDCVLTVWWNSLSFKYFVFDEVCTTQNLNIQHFHCYRAIVISYGSLINLTKGALECSYTLSL